MIQMYINDEEVLCNQELIIKEEMLNTSSTILNNCYPLSWEDTKNYTNNFYYPEDYSMCKILKDNSLIFAGAVKNTGNVNLNPFAEKFCSLQILDFKCLLSEGETLDYVIANKTVLEAIEIVVNSISDYGFIVGNIDILGADDIIGTYSTLNKTAYDVLQYIADITGSKWSTRMIDENTIAVDFYDPLLMPRGLDIEYNQEYFEDNDILDMKFNYSTKDYRNKQIILSKEVYGNIDTNEIIIADGYTQTFMTEQNIGIIKSIIVNGVNKTFGTNEEKEQGIDLDFYYTPGQNILESNTNQPPYIAGLGIKIIYTPLVSGRQIVYNNDEVNRIENQINRKGVISRYETRNDIVSIEELDQVAQTYIKYKGSAEITLTITTRQNLWNIGQVVYFNAPINKLSKDYMVKTKETKIISSINDVFYTYTFTSSFNSERAINYFDNQRSKSEGNIAKGDYITRNIDIETEANIIFDNLEIEEYDMTADNILNTGLNAPFVK